MHNRTRTRIISAHLIPLTLAPGSLEIKRPPRSTPSPERKVSPLSTPDTLERGGPYFAPPRQAAMSRQASAFDRVKAAVRHALHCAYLQIEGIYRYLRAM